MAGFFNFGGTPTLNTSGTQPYQNAINSVLSGYGSQGQSAQQQFGQFNAQDVNAINNLSNYYNSNPATNQYNANATANAAQAARVGAAGATAQLDQNLAARGIGPNSSAEIGGLTSIANQQASTNAQIQAAQGQSNEQQHAANIADNANLWNDVTNTQFGRANTLEQQQADLAQTGFSDADQLAMQQYEQQQQQQAGQDALAGGIFNTAATLFSPGGLWGRAATASGTS
jgi:hypothetical protein